MMSARVDSNLPELDETGPQFGERQRKPLPGPGRQAAPAQARGDARTQRREIGEAERLERVVGDQRARDLGKPHQTSGQAHDHQVRQPQWIAAIPPERLR